MTELAIETRQLRRQFGDTVAVADLSLSVGRGEIFGFLGPNGAGKTTSIKMLLGLLRADQRQRHDARRAARRPRARGRVGFLPEHFRFHDVLTARELLRFHGRLHGLRWAAARRRASKSSSPASTCSMPPIAHCAATARG